MNTGWLVSKARRSADIPVRALADDARVAGSTITRIQSGAVDPTVQTLERILDATGFELHLSLSRHGIPRRPHLGDLVDAWSIRERTLRVDWTRWRAFLDRLELHPELTPEAIYGSPPPSGHHVIDALLAAIAEKLADDAGLLRPAWTLQVPTLDEPYRPPVARSRSEPKVPYQLRARGLLIDIETLWRRRVTTDA